MRIKKSFPRSIKLIIFCSLTLFCRFAAAAEFGVVDKFSVAGSALVVNDGKVGIGTSTVNGSQLAVIGSTDKAYSLAVGTSTNYSLTVSTGGRLQANEIYRGTYTVLDASMLGANGSLKATGIQNTGATAVISVAAATADRSLDYMEYPSSAAAQAAFVTNGFGSYGNTGGTITTDGLYTVHKFVLTDSGTNFTPLKAGNVEYLIVGGGGSGGDGDISGGTPLGGGGGGGAGGFRTGTGFAVTAQPYTITVGDGGAAVTSYNQGHKGGDSVFSTITSDGGGFGGVYGGQGGAGGSGGGGGGKSDGTPTIGGTPTPGQGHIGGHGGGTGGANAPSYGAGGGGGAGEDGAAGSPSAGGNGGAGTASDILVRNSYVTYAGGGGGSVYDNVGTGGSGGSGGGGAAGATNGTAGTPDTGGGGGGGYGTGNSSGKGGSGVVIIRCKTADFLSTTLQSYSESAIKTQGDYSLKGVAPITDSVNKTLTRTVSPTINLSGRTQIKFDIRASTTGSNIKMGLHDSGGTTTEITPNITSSDTWQTITWEISAVTDTNKDAIDGIIVTIVSAPVTNTFYIDNMYAPGNGNNDITFTSGSEKMRIDNSGNVGIGTVDPTAKLEVAGPVKITGGSPAAGGALCLNASGVISKCATGIDSSGNCTCP